MKTTFSLFQEKYECICLGLDQAKNQSASTVYTLYKPTGGNQFSCTVYTQSTAPLPFSGVERALRPSVPSISLQRVSLPGLA